jgi:hypothetical protein
MTGDVTFAGMTGCLVVKGVDAVKYVNAKTVDPDLWPPKCANRVLSTAVMAWDTCMTVATAISSCLQILQDRA